MFKRLCFSRELGKSKPVAGDEPLQKTSGCNPKTTASLKKKQKTNISLETLKASASTDARALPGTREPEVSSYTYEMIGHVQESFDRHLELAKKTNDSLKKVATPWVDYHSLPWQSSK